METFATPPEEDATDKDTHVAMTQLEPTTCPAAAAAAPAQIPALFSPLTSSSSSASANGPARRGTGVPITPEGLRPRPTVREMKTILNLHLGTPVAPPSKPPPKSWFNDYTSQDTVSTPDALRRRLVVPVKNWRPSSGDSDHRYALFEHRPNVANVPTNVALLPPQCIADTVSISSNHHLSMSALTYSPATNAAGLPQQHLPRKGKVSSRQIVAGAGFASPPISFGSPSFFPASVSGGVATTSPAPRRFVGIASSPTLTTSGAKTAVGLLVAESLDFSQSGEAKCFRATTTPLQVAEQSPPSERIFTGIAMSPNLTLSGAKTAVGLATVESFDKCESRASAAGPVSNIVVGNDGVSTPNLTVSGAKTAVGLAIAESFDKEETCGSEAEPPSDLSSSDSLTKVGATIFSDHKTRSNESESRDRMALLPRRDWGTDSSSESNWVSFGGFGPTTGEEEQIQKESQPRTIPNAPSDASSLYEEEGQRLRQQTSRSAASSTVTTPRTKCSKSTEQTPSTAGRTWDHYQQYYAHEDDPDYGDNDESDIYGDEDACEYTALHRPMLELHGSVDVSRDISFSSRQGFLSGGDRGHEGSSRVGASGAYDFGKLDGIASKSALASLDGSSIRPNPSVEGKMIMDGGSDDESFGTVDNLPSSPPRIPMPAHRQINVLPSTPPSLPSGSQHEFDVLPRSLPIVPGSIVCKEDVKYQRPMEVTKEDVDMSNVVLGLDPNVSALSHATGMMSALVGEGDTTVALLPRMEEEDCKSVASGYEIDDALVKRKRKHQVRTKKESQLKKVIDQLRDAPSVVRAICSSKGMLGETATSLFSGFTDISRCSILNEFDSLLGFVFDDNHTRESIRFVQRLVETAPDHHISSSVDKRPSPSTLETPRNVPLTSNNKNGTCWKANDELLRALGIGGYSSPDASERGGDTSLFTLPTNSTTPNNKGSNQSMATTITSEPNSSTDPRGKNTHTSASRRLRLTVEAVVLLLQEISMAACRLPEERLRDDTLWAASVEEIKRGYRDLLQIPSADLENLQAVFTLRQCTPQQSQNCDDSLGPPVLSRGGGNSTIELIETSKRLDLRSPDGATIIHGEINDPPYVVRAMTTFEASSSPRPVVPTVSEEPEDTGFDDNGYSVDRGGHNALYGNEESDSVVTSEPRDLLTSFEDERNDNELTPDSLTLYEADADDEQSQGGGKIEESFIATAGLRDQLGEDLRRLSFDTSTVIGRRDDAEDDAPDSERDGPSELCCSRTMEMSV